MSKKTIKDIVIENAELLKGMKTHTELREWAIKQGFDNRAAFPKFKLALNEIGLDYDQIKIGVFKQSESELEAKINYSLTLYSDAKASADRYGICDKDGNVVWHGKFFDNDDAGEQSRAELAAAKKAVWFASKVMETIGQKALMLNLIVDAEWLTYQDHSGQKGYVLTQMARKYNIKLNVSWISGKQNPADEWTTATGYKKWQDNDFQSLVEKTKENDEISEAEKEALEHPETFKKIQAGTIETPEDLGQSIAMEHQEKEQTIISKSNMENSQINKVNNPNSDYNRLISIANRYCGIPKRKTWQFSPNDKNFKELIYDFAGDADLRPIMSGVFFDSKNKQIACTDAHTLIRFSNVEHKFDGIYPIRWKQDLLGHNEPLKDGKIQGHYPLYNNVISDYVEIKTEVDIKKLYCYIQQIDRAKVTQSITHSAKLSYGEDFYIDVNYRLLQRCLKALLEMGIDKCEAWLEKPNRAIQFRATQESFDVLCLLMPLMINKDYSEDWQGDIDYKINYYASYDLKENCVYSNQRKYVDYIDLSIKKGEGAEIGTELLSVIRTFLKTSKNTLPILDYIAIKNNKLCITDLDIFVTIENIPKEEGLYELVGDDLRSLKTLYADNEPHEIEEFPIIPDDINYYSKIGTFDTLELKEKIKIALNYVGKDDLRPEQQSISFFNYNEKTYIASTDSHGAYFDEMETGILNIKDEDTLVLPANIQKVIELLQDGQIEIYQNHERVMFVFGSTKISSLKLDIARSSLKSFILRNILEQDINYIECIDFDTKKLKSILKKAKDETKSKSRDEKHNVGLELDYENKIAYVIKYVFHKYANKKYFTDEDYIRTGLDIPFANNPDTKQIKNGIIIMGLGAGAAPGETTKPRISEIYINKALKNTDEDIVTLCKVSRRYQMYWSPAPKIINLQATAEKQNVVAKQLLEATEIAAIEAEKKQKEAILAQKAIAEAQAQEEENIRNELRQEKQQAEQLEKLELRLELLQEMIKEAKKKEKEKLQLRAELIEEMIKEIKPEEKPLIKESDCTIVEKIKWGKENDKTDGRRSRNNLLLLHDKDTQLQILYIEKMSSGFSKGEIINSVWLNKDATKELEQFKNKDKTYNKKSIKEKITNWVSSGELKTKILPHKGKNAIDLFCEENIKS